MNVFRRRKPMGCMEVARLLQHYLDGNLDERRTTRFAAHLDDCRRCGMEADTYAQIKASLQRRRRDDLPADAVVRLRAFGETLKQTSPPDAS